MGRASPDVVTTASSSGRAAPCYNGRLMEDGPRKVHPSEVIELTPYVDTLRRDVAQALLRWLGLEDGLPLSWEEREAAAPIGELAVRVGSEPSRLELVLREAQAAARWQDDGLQVTCRRDHGRDPLRDPLLRSWLASLDARFAPARRRRGSADPLRAALDAVRPFARAGIADWMLRRAESTHEGRVGMLIIGHRCNQDCSICFQGRSWPDPPRAMVEQWLEELAAARVETVVLTGGEPTVYRWLPELVDRATGRHGMTVLLQTNAVRLAKASYLRQLIDAGLGGALVAFHSAAAEVSDALTRAPGTHRRTVAGIGNLLAAGVATTLNCCVEVATATGLGEHGRFIVEHFAGAARAAPRCRVEYSQPGAYLDAEQMRRAVAPLDVVRPHLAEAVRALHHAGVPVRWTHPCGFPPCVLRDEPTAMAWERRADYGQAIEDRRFAGPCRRCAARPYCVGLRPEYLEVHGTRGLEPFESLDATQ